jgi:hypothetical protein
MKILSSKKEYTKRESLAKHTVVPPKGNVPTVKKKTGYECTIIDMGDGYFKRSITKKAGGK